MPVSSAASDGGGARTVLGQGQVPPSVLPGHVHQAGWAGAICMPRAPFSHTSSPGDLACAHSL